MNDVEPNGHGLLHRPERQLGRGGNHGLRRDSRRRAAIRRSREERALPLESAGRPEAHRNWPHENSAPGVVGTCSYTRTNSRTGAGARLGRVGLRLCGQRQRWSDRTPEPGRSEPFRTDAGGRRARPPAGSKQAERPSSRRARRPDATSKASRVLSAWAKVDHWPRGGWKIFVEQPESAQPSLLCAARSGARRS